MSKNDWNNIFAYIDEHKEVSEVIFSGGDPLLQSDKHYEWVVRELENIAHLKRLRVHTRLPIVLPNRVTSALIKCFEASRFDSVWVVHCNHAAEIDNAVGTALGRVANSGVTLLNQAVLLRGVNDSVQAQLALSEALFKNSVLPYYLHLLDKVTGAAHFDITEAKAKEIHRGLAARLPGYLVPKLAREEPGAAAKTVIPASVT